MTTHLVTFSDESMSRAAELCVDSALANGVDKCVPTGPSMRPFNWDWLTDSPLFEMHSPEFWRSRGVGYWTWKPYITDCAMMKCVNGDYLIYADAGVEFINNVSHIIDHMDQDIFLFGNNWEHAHWCKRDVIEAIWPTFQNAPMDRPWNAVADSATWTRFGKQCQASVIFFRVSDYSRQFVAEWLKWCLFEGGRLIDDSPSRLPNHPEFQEHRHDQAILTCMSYREGLKLHWWPAIYNRFTPGGPIFTYERGGYQDDYPPLFHHHRLRDSEWPARPIPSAP